MIEISNLIKTLCKSDLDLQAMLDSIPEWKSFEDGMLQTINEVLTTPLVKDPKTKIESLFDDNNEFKFTGFKPVPWWVFLKQNKDDPIGEDDNGEKDDENDGEDEEGEEEGEEKKKKWIDMFNNLDDEEGEENEGEEGE